MKPHVHLCPYCRQPFKCVGLKCGSSQGVAHPDCAPKKSKWTRWVKIVKEEI